MFACLYTLTPRASQLVDVARTFSPRVEARGAVVLLDARGLSRIFGDARELGAHLEAAASAAAPGVRVAVAPTQTTAALMALGRPGTTVVVDEAPATRLAPLPVDTLGVYECLQHEASQSSPDDRWPPAFARQDTDRASAGRHPRDTHQAQQTRPVRLGGRARAADLAAVEDAVRVLRRWGIGTCGALAALPAADLAARLGPRGPRWQRLARGEDARPLVPWVDEPPYEATLELEWPIEGLEPLSFVLGRLLEPLAARLEREQRGAAVLFTRLGLVSREAHARTLQLPAPMRDAKALRTLALLDLERHPPASAIDRVTVVIDPAPGRVAQEALFTRAAPAPEQVATLVARLTALMGEGHVGTPALVDTWRPGAFAMRPFAAVEDVVARSGSERPDAHPAVPRPSDAGACALRRYRMPVPARVRVVEGRPVRVMSDRSGVPGGAVVQCAGPWRASGEWWQVEQVRQGGRSREDSLAPHPPQPYDRDEWDVELADGLVCRIFVERAVGQWFIEGVMD